MSFDEKNCGIEAGDGEGHHHEKNNHLHCIKGSLAPDGEKRGRTKITFEHIEDEQCGGFRRQMKKMVGKGAEHGAQPIHKSVIHEEADDDTADAERRRGFQN